MLIPYNQLIKKYNIQVSGIIHVGAHLAEELHDYVSNGTSNIIWIEANPKLISQIENKTKQYNNIVLNYAIDITDNIETQFNITNNGQSSSLLNLKEHLKEHPNIYVIDNLIVKTKRLDTLINEQHIDMTKFNFINLDIQGLELNALKSLGKYIENIDYIYTEVNNKELYENCNIFDDLDKYLKEFGFEMREINWTPHGWGDAFYTKK